MTKIISVTTQKGGVLKSSIVSNLAGVLSNQGKKILIIDTDSQGSACISFGINPDNFQNTLYDVLINGVDPEKAIINVHNNIDILPSNDDMAFFEIDIALKENSNVNSLFLLKNLIDTLAPKYEMIILDVPPNFGLILGNVLICSQFLLLPFQPEAYSMRSLQKIINKIEEFQMVYNPELKIAGVIGTLVDKRTTLHCQVLDECRKYCSEKGIVMFDTIIPRSIQFAKSVAYDRKPVTLSESNNSRFYKIYSSLCEEVFSIGP